MVPSEWDMKMLRDQCSFRPESAVSASRACSLVRLQDEFSFPVPDRNCSKLNLCYYSLRAKGQKCGQAYGNWSSVEVRVHIDHVLDLSHRFPVKEAHLT